MTTDNEELGTLPALKGLGKLADLRPVIVTDSREQTPLIFRRLPSVRGTLRSGDYSAAGMEEHVAVERKSIGDLISCFTDSNRDRFENELHRLKSFHFKRLLVIGTREMIEQGEYRSHILPKAAINTLSAFEARYGVPVVFEPDVDAAARLVERWIYWSAREIVLNANQLLRGTNAAQTTAN